VKKSIIIPLQVKLLLVFTFISLIFISNLHSATLFTHFEACARDDYYYAWNEKGNNRNRLHYYALARDKWIATTSNVGEIKSGYEYDEVTGRCYLPENLGLTYEQYNFIYALVGLFFGSIFFWLIPSSKK